MILSLLQKFVPATLDTVRVLIVAQSYHRQRRRHSSSSDLQHLRPPTLESPALHWCSSSSDPQHLHRDILHRVIIIVVTDIIWWRSDKVSIILVTLHCDFSEIWWSFRCLTDMLTSKFTSKITNHSWHSGAVSLNFRMWWCDRTEVRSDWYSTIGSR